MVTSAWDVFYFQAICVLNLKWDSYSQDIVESCFYYVIIIIIIIYLYYYIFIIIIIIHSANLCLLVGVFSSFTFNITAGFHSCCAWEAVFKITCTVLKTPQNSTVLTQSHLVFLSNCSLDCCKPLVNFQSFEKVDVKVFLLVFLLLLCKSGFLEVLASLN